MPLDKSNELTELTVNPCSYRANVVQQLPIWPWITCNPIFKIRLYFQSLLIVTASYFYLEANSYNFIFACSSAFILASKSAFLLASFSALL